MVMWPEEIILDPHILYLRVHDNNVRDGKLIPGSFKEHGEGEKKGMSTDWSKYSTVLDSLSRAKSPAKNSIVSFITGLLRYYTLTVLHSPEDNNRAHTDVKGADQLEVRVRLKLLNIYDWEHQSDYVLNHKN